MKGSPKNRGGMLTTYTSDRVLVSKHTKNSKNRVKNKTNDSFKKWAWNQNGEFSKEGMHKVGNTKNN